MKARSASTIPTPTSTNAVPPTAMAKDSRPVATKPGPENKESQLSINNASGRSATPAALRVLSQDNSGGSMTFLPQRSAASVIRPVTATSNIDISPDSPLSGEKPNDMLMRLFDQWPSQLAPSYRAHVQPSPEATAEYNLRYLKELYPSMKQRLRKVKAAGLAVESMFHLQGKKFHFKAHLSS